MYGSRFAHGAHDAPPPDAQALGLVPMVLGVNVDLLGPSLGIGAPSTQWWTQMSSAIAGGLTFATILTLLLTPCLLLLGSRFEKQPPPLEVGEDDLLDLPESLLQKLPLPRSDKQAVL